MTRRAVAFTVGTDQCIGSLDLPDNDAPRAGVLIISGGNEIRSGPHGSYAELAAHFAALGFPVLRFDRPGVGDSEGDNNGWRGAGLALECAMATLRQQCPSLTHVVGFGICDAASSLIVHGDTTKFAEVIGVNPWAFDHDDTDDGDDDAPQHSRGSALRYYARRLSQPGAVLRDLLKGRIGLGKLVSDAAQLSAATPPTRTGALLARNLPRWGDKARILVSKDDRTGAYFMEQWHLATADQGAIETRATASHDMTGAQDRSWLYAQILAALERVSAP